MRIDEKLVKISLSKIPIEYSLDLGDDVTIVISGTVVKISQEDNQDGSCNEVYTIKGVVGEVARE